MFTAFVVFPFLTIFGQTFASSCYEFSPVRRYSTVDSKLTCYNVSSVMDLHLPPMYRHTKQKYEQYMEIKNSNVTTLPKGAFSRFRYMNKLHLSRIHLRIIESGAFDNLSELQELYLNDNELTELTSGMFSFLPDLHFLELSRNKIRHIENSTFRHGFRPHSLNLHLEYNFITTFEDDSFEGVRYLDLSGNPLKKISKVRPSTLKLSNANLTKFDVDMSNGTTGHLDLSSNQLYTFNFTLLPVIVKYLDLSNNAIVSVNVDDSLDIYKLNLSNNQIRRVNGILNVMCRCFVSGEIDLSYNKVEVVEALSFNTSKISRIDILDLSHNEITTINKNAFSRIIIRRRLLLSFNSISKIPVGLFKGMDQLSELDLSANGIESFQSGIFDGLSGLKVLNISNNNLIELSPHTLHPLSSLLELHFENNKIFSLESENLVTYFPYLKEMSLDHNRWNCEDLVSIRQTFLKHGKKISSGDSFDVENHYGIACTARVNFGETGGNFSGFSFKNFYNDTKNSIDDDVLKSKMIRFFNGDFKNTKYFQTVNQTVSVKSDSPNSKPLGALTITQILIFTLIFVLGCLLYVSLRRLRSSYKAKVASRLELVGTKE